MKRMNRRRFVQGGAGALLALPLLESLWGRKALARTPSAPQRALWWFTPNGQNMEDWAVSGTGSEYTLSPILTPFAPFREQMTVVSGLRNYGVSTPGADDSGHSGCGAWLHCSALDSGGVSVDQQLAAQIGSDTLFPSLELGRVATDGDHRTAVSWAQGDLPLPKIITASALFARLFGASTSLSPEEALRERNARVSVLDGVLEDLNSLAVRLPAQDQIKLDQYSTAVRELEVRIGRAGESSCDPGEAPGRATNEAEEIDNLCAVMVLALQCDLTRVMTFMLGGEANNVGHNFLGVPESYHGLSHHNYDPAQLAKLTIIQTWQCQVFADSLLSRLAATPDVDGKTLLDNTSVLYGSGIGDSHYHNNYDLPAVLFGGTSTFAHGHHLAASEQPLANLHLAICGAAGAELNTLGTAGVEPLAGLT